MGSDLPQTKTKTKIHMEKWNAKIRVPTDTNYVVRCIEASFGPAKSSNNVQITLVDEIISPASINVAGKDYSLAGVKCNSYHTVKVFDNDVVNVEKTKNAKARVEKLYASYGLSTEGLDWENLDVSGFKGKCVCVQISAKPDEQRRAPTAEQIATAQANNAQPLGDILTNPITGEKLANYWPRINEVFGIAPESAMASGAAGY